MARTYALDKIMAEKAAAQKEADDGKAQRTTDIDAGQREADGRRREAVPERRQRPQRRRSQAKRTSAGGGPEERKVD